MFQHSISMMGHDCICLLLLFPMCVIEFGGGKGSDWVSYAELFIQAKNARLIG